LLKKLIELAVGVVVTRRVDIYLCGKQKA